MTARRETAWLLATRLLAVGLLVTAATGCSLGGGDEADRPPAPTTTTSTIPPATGSAQIELLDPGVEPRTPLRLSYEVGDEVAVVFTSDLRIDQEVGGRRQVLDSPPVTQIVTYEVTSADATGAEVAFTVDQVRIDAEGTALTAAQALSLQFELSQIEGLGGRTTIDPTGQATELRLDDRPPLDAAVAARLDDLTLQIGATAPALPTEAVGIGARWRVVQRTERAGHVTERTTTYELTGLTPDGIEYTATTQVRSDERAVDGAVVAPATLAGTLTGTTSLARPTFTLDSVASGEQVVTTGSGQEAVQLVQEIEVAYSAVAVAPAN